MTKHRLRLTNGRVIGPFDLHQIHDLKLKGHIHGKEEAQVFPLGEWKPLSEFDFYHDIMDEDKTIVESSNHDSTFVLDLSQLRNKRNEAELEKMAEPQVGPEENLTETIYMSPASTVAEKQESKTAVTISQEVKLPSEISGDDDERTLINPVAQEEIQRMRREQIEEERVEREKEEERQRRIEEEREKSLARKALIVSPEDATQVISLEKTELLNLAILQEKENDKEVQAFLEKRKEEEDEFDDEEEEEELEEPEEESRFQKLKKNKLLLIVAAIAFLYVIIFPDDEKPKKPPFKHLDPQIVFAIPFDKKDSKASTVLYQKGMENYVLGTYPHLINSGKFFLQSVENDYDNITAYSMMIRTYGEQLKFSKKKLEDALTLFKAIQLKKQYIIHNPDGVVGMNLFYMGISKPEAAVDVVKKYLRLYPKKVTQDLFAAYLSSLIKTGQVDDAREFFSALEKQKEKSRFALESMIEYLRLNQKDEEAMKLVDEGIKRFPNTSIFFLLKCDLLIRKQELDKIPELLMVVENKMIEYNDLYRAKFFEISGLYWAIKGNVKQATGFLKRSLDIHDSTDLRVKLAMLEKTGSSPEVDSIIGQSQAMKILIEAQDFYAKKNYALAMSAAARATEAFPGHIPSELFLAKTQMKLGLASDSLKTLEKLIQKYPGNKAINLALIEAYTESYKFNDARTRMSVISGTEIRDTWEYASINARLFQKMGDLLKAIAWYRSSINANPLNDKDIYQLAEIFIRRKNFPQARTLLNNAMELDPINPDYRISYSRLIYETEDDQAAIGYLLGLMNDFGENPKILGEIATLYYKVGKIKDFQDYKIKLEKLTVKDKALYEFLIKSALLDERYDDIPKLVEELLKIEPGDLESMMTAGKVLFENEKYFDSALWFKRLWERMPTYPMVLYYIARIKFIAGEIDDPVDASGNPLIDENGDKRLGALSLVKNDIKENGETDLALVFMADIFVRKGNFVEAENYYKKAQKINPRSYEALVGLADLSTRRNNFDLALDLYKRALSQRPDEAVLHKKIGDVYRLLGQGSLAIESYKMYLEMNPEASDKPQIQKYINLMQ